MPLCKQETIALHKGAAAMKKMLCLLAVALALLPFSILGFQMRASPTSMILKTSTCPSGINSSCLWGRVSSPSTTSFSLLMKGKKVATKLFSTAAEGCSSMQLTSKQGGGSSGKAVDFATIGKWIFATLLQFGSIAAFLWAAERGFARLPVTDKLDLAKIKLWAVRFFFLFMSLRSRVFSVLDASRPSVASEAQMKREEKRPSWMPPAKAFPVIWISIAFLRTISSSLIYEYTGTLLNLPILAFFAHLSIGDTWNHVTNVRRLKGASVPGVFTVWLSVVTAVYLYGKTLPLAGKVLLPSAVWISIANVLVYTIWKMNTPDEPWYPVKEKSE